MTNNKMVVESMVARTKLNRRRQFFQGLAIKCLQWLGTHGRHRKSLKITPGQEFCALLCGLRAQVFTSAIVICVSGRNQLVGRIDSVRISGLMAEVKISIGDSRLRLSSPPPPPVKCDSNRARLRQL